MKNNINLNSKVRLLSNEGKMLGIFNFKDALSIAKQEKLDIITVAHNLTLPVCKIVNLKKYQYKIKRKFQNAKKKHKIFTTKEIKIRINIASGDFTVKLNNAKRFLIEGNRVKISLFLRGREAEHKNLGVNIIQKFQKCLEKFSDTYVNIFREGKNLIGIVLPKKNNL